MFINCNFYPTNSILIKKIIPITIKNDKFYQN